jgi:hypothetical protein
MFLRQNWNLFAFGAFLAAHVCATVGVLVWWSAALECSPGGGIWPTRHHGRRSQCRSWHKRGRRYPPCVSLPCDRIYFCVCTAQLVESLTTHRGSPHTPRRLRACVMNTSTLCHTLSISVGLPSCCCRCCLFCCACRRTALSSTMQHHEVLLGHHPHS